MLSVPVGYNSCLYYKLYDNYRFHHYVFHCGYENVWNKISSLNLFNYFSWLNKFVINPSDLLQIKTIDNRPTLGIINILFTKSVSVKEALKWQSCNGRGNNIRLYCFSRGIIVPTDMCLWSIAMEELKYLQRFLNYLYHKCCYTLMWFMIPIIPK